MGKNDAKWIVKTIAIDGLYYVYRWVGCGKPNCKKCPHGPYWYCNFTRKGKHVSVYLGAVFKTLAERNEEKKQLRREHPEQCRTATGKPHVYSEKERGRVRDDAQTVADFEPKV